MLSGRLSKVVAVAITYVVITTAAVNGRAALAGVLLWKMRRKYPEMFVGAAALKSVEQAIRDTIKEELDGANSPRRVQGQIQTRP